MPDRILIVEDEPKIAALLDDYLRASAFDTEIIADGAEVVPRVREAAPALMLLDLMLPNRDGISICGEIRQFSNLPIIMVTAKSEEIDRLLGLELGADDYICKPFSPREVVARVKAVLRRGRAEPASEPAPVRIDAEGHRLYVDGREIPVTTIEFQLFALMLGQPGRIWSRGQLMDHMYSDQRVVSERTVDSHIKKLRRKIGETCPGRELIHSVYGAGYRYEV